jgi:hypothetical protein
MSDVAPGAFRKKPIVIQAMQWTGTEDNIAAFFDWFEALDKSGPKVLESMPPQLEIRTLEGAMRASVGDWIICGVKGEIYPCKPDIFDATYEKW